MNPEASTNFENHLREKKYLAAIRVCEEVSKEEAPVALSIATHLIQAQETKLIKAQDEQERAPSLQQILNSITSEIQQEVEKLLQTTAKDDCISYLERKILLLMDAKAVLDLILEGTWSFQNWLKTTFEYGLATEQAIEERKPLPENLLAVVDEKESVEGEEAQEAEGRKEGSDSGRQRVLLTV